MQTISIVLNVQSAFVDVQQAQADLGLARETLTAFNEIVAINTERVRTALARRDADGVTLVVSNAATGDAVFVGSGLSLPSSSTRAILRRCWPTGSR